MQSLEDWSGSRRSIYSQTPSRIMAFCCRLPWQHVVNSANEAASIAIHRRPWYVHVLRRHHHRRAIWICQSLSPNWSTKLMIIGQNLIVDLPVLAYSCHIWKNPGPYWRNEWLNRQISFRPWSIIIRPSKLYRTGTSWCIEAAAVVQRRIGIRILYIWWMAYLNTERVAAMKIWTHPKFLVSTALALSRRREIFFKKLESHEQILKQKLGSYAFSTSD